MGVRSIGLIVLLACGLALAAGAAPATKTEAGGEGRRAFRVGQYDARAVAVAWAVSNPHAKIMADKVDEMKNAKAAGDQAKIKSLEEWGKRHQETLHRQGFSGADVSDILARVKDQVPGVAQSAGVDVLVRRADYLDPSVEVVDVTDELVKLFEPSERTLKAIAALKKQPVVDEDSIRD
jgi:hypothetical protein